MENSQHAQPFGGKRTLRCRERSRSEERASSKRNEDRGQPTMARPSAGVAGHDQAPCRGGQPWPDHLQGGDRLWPRPPTKGRSATVMAPYKGAMGCSTCSAVPVRAIGCRAPARAKAATACVGATTATQRGQDGLRQSFCEKDNPTPLNSRNFKDCPHV
ncbi:hypothetical protein B296_00017232 [Ensete ventricosum]|uniref:Uncharacterized protein n=1 Tax=Ensete ventricosum TaxID=4639 RepID=A0A426ZXY8_ENSVE|nr:hypothetical protein B296_00017232 [Ensete ventricosum]